MLRRGTVCVAALVALGLGACGGDDDGGGSSEPPKEPVARCTPAPANAKSITVKPKWKIGDRRTVTILKSREDTDLDEPVLIEGSAQVQVIDTGSKGSSLRWQGGVESFPAGVVLLDAEDVSEVNEQVDPLRIEYATDSDGAIDQVGNLSSLRTQVSAILSALAEASGEEQIESFRRVAESDAFLQTAMIEDPTVLHFMYGIKAKRGETVEGEYELPNPFGGDPFPSTARYTLTTPRDRSGCAVFDVRIDADDDAIPRILKHAVGQLAPGESIDESDLDDLDLRHEMSFSYDPGSGWLARAELKKIVTAAKRRRTDRTLIVTR